METKISFEKGIKDTLDWYNQNRKFLNKISKKL